MSWWSTNLILRGKHIVLADFDTTMMSYCIDEAKLDYKDGNKDPDIEKPDNFSHRKWVSGEKMVYNYFTTTRKIRGAPLAYIISKNPFTSGIVIDRE